MNYKYFLSVCLCIKNERKYMGEFIEHYVKQGVDHFYIINNNSQDNIEEFIENSIYKNTITLITDNRNMNILQDNSGTQGHVNLLNENLYDLIKEETEWAIVIDADEFITGMNGYTIKSYLHTVDDDIGRVYVMWNIFNPDKTDTNTLNDFSLENNVKRINHDYMRSLSYYIQNANDFGKSIVRTAMLIDTCKFWLHKIRVSGKKINNYNEIDDNMYDNVNNITYSEEGFKKLHITLNHYAIRDKDDYEKKKKQLNCVSGKVSFINGLLEMLDLDEKYFVIDRSITKK